MSEMERLTVFLGYIGFLGITITIIGQFIIVRGHYFNKNCIYFMGIFMELREGKRTGGKFILNLVGKITLLQSFFMILKTRPSALKILVPTGTQQGEWIYPISMLRASNFILIAILFICV